MMKGISNPGEPSRLFSSKVDGRANELYILTPGSLPPDARGNGGKRWRTERGSREQRRVTEKGMKIVREGENLSERGREMKRGVARREGEKHFTTPERRSSIEGCTHPVPPAYMYAIELHALSFQNAFCK